jgi:hypothetical protein
MSAHWVRASLPPMLGPVPAWVIIPAPYMLLSFGVTSVAMMVASLAVGMYLAHKGRTLMWTVRRFRTKLRGYRMDARPLGYRRAMTMDVAMHDFDFAKWRES